MCCGLKGVEAKLAGGIVRPTPRGKAISREDSTVEDESQEKSPHFDSVCAFRTLSDENFG